MAGYGGKKMSLGKKDVKGAKFFGMKKGKVGKGSAGAGKGLKKTGK